MIYEFIHVLFLRFYYLHLLHFFLFKKTDEFVRRYELNDKDFR